MRAAPILRHERGSSAAEFALILPVFILFLLGLIDVGRWVWSFSELEKATQTGARWAVATDMIPSDLITYSFATQGNLTQGTVVGGNSRMPALPLGRLAKRGASGMP